MILYLESSAVLAWLLGEPACRKVRAAIRAASTPVTSTITIVECERALIRGVATGRIPAILAARRRVRLERVARHWTIAALTDRHVQRARQPFPQEPIRTQDALHLGTVLGLRDDLPEIVVLSLDDRIRKNAEALGFDLRPATPARTRSLVKRCVP